MTEPRYEGTSPRIPSDPGSASAAEFDSHADTYDHSLARGISVSGESKDFFARGRLSWLATRIRRLGLAPHRIMEFGCGLADSVPLLFEILDAHDVVGIDVSTAALGRAAARFGSENIRFATPDRYLPNGQIELAVSNGVFHHIPPRERRDALDFVWKSLAPGGLFALFDNSRWHPGARYVMSRIPFDRDAIPLSAGQARRALRAAGFELVGTDYLFVFPRFLAAFRPLESFLSALPLGAQFLVLARKPERR